MVGILGSPRGLGAAALIALSSAPACSGKVVDVGGSKQGRHGDGAEGPKAPIYATAAPPLDKELDGQWKLVDKEWMIGNLVADGGRVFWVAAYMATEIKSDAGPLPATVIRNCAAADCKGTLQSLNIYTKPNIPIVEGSLTPLTMAINQTGVFWLNPLIGGGASYCTRDHCTAAQLLNPTPDSQTLLTFAADETYFYFAANKRLSFRPDNALARCEIANCAATASRLAMTAPAGEPPYDGTSQIVSQGDYLYLNSGPRLIRRRKDGTDSFEVVARDRPGEGVVAVRGESVFWTESPASGRILACPISGCIGDPRVVVSTFEAPDNLTVDDEYVYFSYSYYTPWSPGKHWPSDRLLRCAIAGCSEPTLIAEGLGIEAPVATDDEFVYFSGNGCRHKYVSEALNEPCSYIAAVRK